MFDTPEHEMEFLVNCRAKIMETYNICLVLRKKYKASLSSKSISDSLRKELEEKNQKNEDEIEYFEKSINYIDDRKIYVQRKIEEYAQKRKEKEEKKDN